MKERPIIFNSEMVRAILKGEKTQTRRVMKSPPPEDMSVDSIQVGWYYPIAIDKDGNEEPGELVFGAYDEDGEWGAKCPYGAWGDELWVRETWFTCNKYDDVAPSKIMDIADNPPHVWYPASHWLDGSTDEQWKKEMQGKRRPSIFMPRWASRIQLRIVKVWVERVQDIADPQAEGVGYWGCDTIEVFEDLWDSINAKRGFSFASNPWVWAVEFEVV
jgi:hypothetical protein